MLWAHVAVQAHIDAASPHGQTALYDALAQARDELEEVVEKHGLTRCVRRILCLTDGEDTTSKASPEVVTASLQVCASA